MTTNQCPKCSSGHLRVYSTRVSKELGYRIRYRRCNECREPEKMPQLVPLEFAPVQLDRCKSRAEVG